LVRLYASEIATVANGQLHGDDCAFDGASIDSRQVAVGQLFVAVVAERDGHDFVPAAVEAGAAAVLADRPLELDIPVIEVADTMAGLAAAGVLARTCLPDRVVGVTGSVGKTSVKDLTASVLGTTFVTAASERSFNNELGVPLTLLNAPGTTAAAVIEMGARGRGHIADLCAIATPTVGVVTSVAAVHTELFGTLADVAQAKGELVEALPADGFAVLNADDPAVLAMAERTEATVVTYGTHGDVRTGEVHLDEELCPRFVLELGGEQHAVQLAMSGKHNAGNALAAAAVGHVCGIDLPTIAQGLAQAMLSPWRMELRHSAAGGVVINDAYNANPTSMRAALDSLAAFDADRRLAVLGAMGELGDGSDAAHREVAEYAAGLDIEVLAVACGAYGADVRQVASADEAVTALGPIRADMAVLVKASRAAGLERLAIALAPLAPESDVSSGG
jgi:UDP-N-acetylmuramoyl-tripeptide--D-alanyl-D-alanine ligase